MTIVNEAPPKISDHLEHARRHLAISLGRVAEEDRLEIAELIGALHRLRDAYKAAGL